MDSSNFTQAGITYNTELNSVSHDSGAKYTREEWFDKFWRDAYDFKNQMISILESSRFGSSAYFPYQVYIKALYELQRNDIREHNVNDLNTLRQKSSVRLTEFQQDAIDRVFSRLRKYGSILIADSVGLGKTWIAKKIIENYALFKRKQLLIICPSQLKGMWSKELKRSYAY